MKKAAYYLLALALGVLANLQAAVNLNSTHYTTNDGLSNNFVRHIYQDTKGYLWLSSTNGLTRYDGHSFVCFQPGKEGKISLLDHHVRNVEEDANHFLWIQLSPENFSCYDLRKEQFVDFTGRGDYRQRFSSRYSMSNGDTWLTENGQGCRRVTLHENKYESTLLCTKSRSLPSDSVTKIIEDVHHNVFLATAGGLVQVCNQKVRTVNRVKNIYDLMLYENRIYMLTREGAIYRFTTDGLRTEYIQSIGDTGLKFPTSSGFRFHDNWVILTPGKGTVFNLKQEKIIPSELFNISNGNFVMDKKGNVCIFNDQGLLRFVDKSTGKVKELQITIRDLASSKWCKIIQDSRGWEWFATFGDGLYVYNPATDEVTHFRYQVDAENYICSNSLTYITEDRSGAIWLASESAGVSRLNVQTNNVNYIFPDDRSLINNSNSVRLIHQMSNGNIWIGNRDGDVYQYDVSLTRQLKKTHFESSIYALQEDKKDGLMIGSRSSGMCINNQWISKGNDSQTLPSEKISLFFKDFKARTWVGTFSGGLTLMERNASGQILFKRFFSDNSELMSVRSIVEDARHWMWVGTDFGLYIFHPDSLIAHPTKFYKYNFDNGGLRGNRVKYVYRDSHNRFWVGTMGGGVSYCQDTNKYGSLKFKHFTTDNGLTNNIVQSILEDRQGHVWVATEYGISRISVEANSVENFFFAKSIQGNVYNESSALRLPDNRLLFGTYHGVLVIDPTRIKSPGTISRVVLTDLKVNGIPAHPDDEDSPLSSAIAYSDKVELKYNQSSITIDFSTFDYLSDKTTKYSYKLEPYDTEWSTPSSLNFASYKKLPPGKYKLRVKACNAAGIWSKNETLLEIVVHPPFWASGWAYLLYLLITLLLLYFTIKVISNFNKLQHRISLEKELTDYKLLFFTNISHEFRTPLTLMKGALEKMDDIEIQSTELAYPLQLMRKSTDRLLRLVNQLMEFRKMQTSKLTLMLEQTDVVAFCQEIFYDFEEIAADKNISFRFDIFSLHADMYVDKGKLDKIVYNLLSNAFKYTPAGGKVTFSISTDAESRYLKLRVADTGLGIPEDKREDLFSRFMQTSFSRDSVGIGLHLTYELVTVHKGTIAYQEHAGGGSVFTVTLPMDAEMYSPDDFSIATDTFDEIPAIVQPETNEAASPEEAAETTATGKKILVIEDDAEVRKFIKHELSAYFEVQTASDGIEGLAAAKAFDGDLIVCDVMMPGMNGFEVTRELKTNFETSHLPIILLTALSTTENQVEGTQTGADAYITKPFSTRLLLARIMQLIEQREKLRDKYAKDPNEKSPVITTSELDQRFADKLNMLMDKHLDDPDFSLDDFSEKLGLGRTVFFRKVKGVTGYTPNEYMRVYRLKKALELLKEGKYNVSEVTFMVGLNDPLYFSRCFKKQFGVAPSIYLRGDKRNVDEIG